MTARLATLVVTLLLAAPLAAQQPDAPRLHGNGTELFRGLLHYHGLKPATIDDLRDRNYSSTIVILFGAAKNVDGYDIADVCRVPLLNGAAVLIADDSLQNYTPYFLKDSNVPTLSGTGEPVYHATGGLNTLGSCPYVVPRAPFVRLGQPTEWTLFENLPKIATNRPGALQYHRASPFTRNILAEFPARATTSAKGGVELGKDRCFAVGGSGTQANPFRCLVLADQDVFANQMIAAIDTQLGPTDNLMFANRVVEWLKDANGVNRTRCIFIDGSTIHDKFDEVRYDALAMPPIPVPPIPNPLDPKVQEAFVNMANETLARWQDRDGPNAALIRNPPDEYRFNRVLRILAVVAAIVIVLLLLLRSWRAGHSPDTPTIPTDTGRIAASGAPGSLARRKEEILQAGNYTDVVREYLQELFFQQGLPNPAPERMPQVETSGRDRRTLLDDLDTLWDVAFGDDPTPILYSRWKELEPMIDAVRRAADNGRWHFKPGGRA